MIVRILLISLCWLGLFAESRAADWLQFRGPGGLGIAQDKDLPATWGPKENLIWKTALPGEGASCPIVVGDKIFLTCYSGYGTETTKDNEIKDLKRHLVCLDRAGKIIWKSAVSQEVPESPFSGFVALHGYASATPVSDGKNVFAFFGNCGVYAYDLEGKELWHASVGTKKHVWGSGTSPLLCQDLVIVNASIESGSMVALKKSDGSKVWAVPGMIQSWTTPLLIEVGGHQEVVVSVQDRLRALDPATGTELWNCDGIHDYVCPSVIANEGVVYVIGARQNISIAVKAGGKGDVSATHTLWKLKKGSNVSSPVYHQGHLYWASESRGMFYCVKADKGELVYEERLEPRYERIYGSATVADGKIYLVSRTDGAYVLSAEPKFKLLAHNKLDDKSVFNASPVVVDGQILLRSNRFLYCIGKK